MSNLTVNYLDEDKPFSLYMRHWSESRTQPVVFELDLMSGPLGDHSSAELSVLPVEDTNMTPIGAIHGTILLWGLDEIPTAALANRILKAIEPDARKIQAHTTIEWTGEAWIGVADDEARKAYDRVADWIRVMLEGSDETITDITAEEWFADSGEIYGLTADTTSEEIEQLAKENCWEAASDNMILRGALTYLMTKRDRMADQKEWNQ